MIYPSRNIPSQHHEAYLSYHKFWRHHQHLDFYIDLISSFRSGEACRRQASRVA